MRYGTILWINILLCLVGCGDSVSSQPAEPALPPQVQALQDGESLRSLQIGIRAMERWLEHGEDANNPMAVVQDRMLLVVKRHVEPLPPDEKVALAAQLMKLMYAQENLGYELYMSGSAGRIIVARYAKLRGRLCQLMGNKPGAAAEYESCLDVIGLDDAEAKKWRKELKEK